jgi:proline racemase
MHRIDIIDSHTGGEPTRVVLAGFPDLGSGSVAERAQRLRREHDRWRQAIVCEPRGSDHLVGALLLPPSAPDCCTGVIFFNNAGTLGMCGHGAIGVIRGVVEAELHPDDRVSIGNVESYRLLADVSVETSEFGLATGDVAWGGNWFFITTGARWPLRIEHWRELTTQSAAIAKALFEAGVSGADGAVIDHVDFNAPSPTAGCDGRNFVLCPGLAYDRSPCGTGTSAKLACLAADGKLAPGQIWRQESITGSVFEASYQPGRRGGVLPTITGTAHITGCGELLIDEGDELAWGFRGQGPEVAA